MTLMRVRLELARTPSFPSGSARHGYEFIAPVNSEGRIDAMEWKERRGDCTVVRFWGDHAAEHGHLRHVGHGWRFDYDPAVDADDEPLFKLDRHRLALGNYVSLTEKNGEQIPFRVVGILPVRETKSLSQAR